MMNEKTIDHEFVNLTVETNKKGFVSKKSMKELAKALFDIINCNLNKFDSLQVFIEDDSENQYCVQIYKEHYYFFPSFQISISIDCEDGYESNTYADFGIEDFKFVISYYETSRTEI